MASNYRDKIFLHKTSSLKGYSARVFYARLLGIRNINFYNGVSHCETTDDLYTRNKMVLLTFHRGDQHLRHLTAIIDSNFKGMQPALAWGGILTLPMEKTTLLLV